MKVRILQVCTGSPDDVHTYVYTDGREYDLPDSLAKKLIEEGKAKAIEVEKKSQKEARHGKD